MTRNSEQDQSAVSKGVVLFLDLGIAIGLSHALGCSPFALDIGSAAFCLLLLGHHRPFVWRKPGVALFAALAFAALAFAAASIGHELKLATAWVHKPLWFLLVPIPGHLFALIPPRRTTPLRIVGTHAQRHFFARWFRHGRHPFRPANVGEEAEEATLDSRDLADLSTRVVTSKGSFPFHPEAPTRGMSHLVKRLMDFVLVGLALPPVLFLCFWTTILVPLRMGFPAFYSQERITAGGRRFRIWKFRSMIQDAEPDGVAVWPQDEDPRITPFGRLLRRLWIDELPQLYNVLNGDMSLVGPRPERPEFVQEFERSMPTYHLRYQVAAGMTGLAQVRGLIGNTSIARRLRKDLRYVLLWSPGLDLYLIAATLSQVSRRLLAGIRKRFDDTRDDRSTPGGA